MDKYICNICNKEFTDQLEFAQHCVDCHKKHKEEVVKAKQKKDEEKILALYNECEEALDNYFKTYPSSCLYVQTKNGKTKIFKSCKSKTFIDNIFDCSSFWGC